MLNVSWKNSYQSIPKNIKILTLLLMGCFQTLVLMGGGGSKGPPPFLFVKTIEKVIRLCIVLKKFFFECEFWRAIFHGFQLSYDGGGALCAHYRSIDRKSLISGAQQ